MSKETEIIKVKYRSSIKKDGDIKVAVYDWVSAEIKCTRRYNAAMCLMMGVTGCPAHLMEWISGNMTDGGFVHNNVITRQAFISFYLRHRGKLKKSYGEDAVNKAFKQLCDVGFLISISKGTYKVDPLLYYADDDTNRVASIKYIMEFKSGVETKVTREVKSK